MGAVFGRNRPAAGFSLDVKAIAECVATPAQDAAIRAPWGEQPALRAAVRRLRAQGNIVLAVLPGHEVEAQAFHCDQELVQVGGEWALRAVGSATGA